MIVIVGLSRQYRTMQAELTRKVETLEEEVSKLKEELGMNISIFFLYLHFSELCRSYAEY